MSGGVTTWGVVSFYNGSMSIRVLLVSRGMFHDGLVRVLEDRPADVEIIGSAESWAEAKGMMEEAHPDVLIADYHYAEEMMADLERIAAHDNDLIPDRILFVILDENKVILYKRRQITDITIDRLIEVL